MSCSCGKCCMCDGSFVPQRNGSRVLQLWKEAEKVVEEYWGNEPFTKQDAIEIFLRGAEWMALQIVGEEDHE